MTRSHWKGKFIDTRIFHSKAFISNDLLLKKHQKKVEYFIWSRNSIIPSFFNKKRIAVYNGKFFKSYIVKNLMLNNFKFGEFCLTKSLGKKIHVVKKKKKAKKLKKEKIAD